jgi:hypothetical protein
MTQDDRCSSESILDTASRYAFSTLTPCRSLTASANLSEVLSISTLNIKAKVRTHPITISSCTILHARSTTPVTPTNQALPLIIPKTTCSSTLYAHKISLYITSRTNRHIVIDAYTRSLRIVFISAIAMFFIVNILVFAIELPHLKKKRADVEEREEEAVENGT